jgi:integrase
MNFKAFVRAKAKRALTDATIALYERDARSILGWLGARPLNVETAQDAEAWLRSKTDKPNTLQRWFTSLNWLLAWKGVDYKAKRPPKELNLNPRTISDEEYDQAIARLRDPMERLAVLISHEAGWSPSDVVQIRRADVDLTADRAVIRRFRQKTKAVGMPIFTEETTAELRAYLAADPDIDYLFPGDNREGRPHRNRTWVNAVLKRTGATFSPRAFRSNLATKWPGDNIEGLMRQGMWKTSSTIFQSYRGNSLPKQTSSLDAALGRTPKDPKSTEDVPGYG